MADIDTSKEAVARVTRWNANIEQFYRNVTGKPKYRAKMFPDITGKYVTFEDYAALSRDLEAMRAERDASQARVAELEEALRALVDLNDD